MVSVAWGETMPQTTAAHFCQLLVKTNEGRLMSLHAFIRQTPAASDSLTIEQQFADYVFHYGGWQSLRIFPHQQGQQVAWYSASDNLPASMSEEHQKYICQVFPRLISEVQAENWQAVDAYIDRMLQYQCQFGGNQASNAVSSSFLVVVGLIFVVVILVSRFFYVLLSPKRK